MKNTLGPRGILTALKREWPLIVRMIPTTPRELLTQIHRTTIQTPQLLEKIQHLSNQQLYSQHKYHRLQSTCIILIAVIIIILIRLS